MAVSIAVQAPIYVATVFFSYIGKQHYIIFIVFVKLFTTFSAAMVSVLTLAISLKGFPLIFGLVSVLDLQYHFLLSELPGRFTSFFVILPFISFKMSLVETSSLKVLFMFYLYRSYFNL